MTRFLDIHEACKTFTRSSSCLQSLRSITIICTDLIMYYINTYSSIQNWLHSGLKSMKYILVLFWVSKGRISKFISLKYDTFPCKATIINKVIGEVSVRRWVVLLHGGRTFVLNKFEIKSIRVQSFLLGPKGKLLVRYVAQIIYHLSLVTQSIHYVTNYLVCHSPGRHLASPRTDPRSFTTWKRQSLR